MDVACTSHAVFCGRATRRYIRDMQGDIGFYRVLTYE